MIGTDIYKSIDQGQAVMLGPQDRILYPPPGIEMKTPESHLIVDYGIMESDGDDIKAMQDLSSKILVLAKQVLELLYPEYSPLTEVIARETETLLHAIMALNSDDRMAVGTVHLTNERMRSLLAGTSYHEFSRRHAGRSYEFPWSSDWEYRVHFRLLTK